MTNIIDIDSFIKQIIADSAEDFSYTDEVALHNQRKVLNAFSTNGIALRHFAMSEGYGYADVGRGTLGKVVADIFGAESAIASPLIASGTHALTLALFGVLRPGDTVLSVGGMPYDTLHDVIFGSGNGSLEDFGIKFCCLPLKDDMFDFEKIADFLQHNNVKMVYVQRSRGYDWRSAFSVAQIGQLCEFVRKYNSDCCIMCDNCYGEFVETLEPTNVGVDICAGSFIKNIGGGIAPTGGYIVGSAKYVGMVEDRLTAPSIGCEVGSYARGYREFFQGIFLAPHVVAQAIKTATLFCRAFDALGFEVKPSVGEKFHDIVCSIKLNSEQNLVSFCKSVQSVSPVDGYVVPEPSEMPGYADKVVSAAGCFVEGASIELSCDGPVRAPFVVYLQGGLTFEHGVIALEKVLQDLNNLG